MRPQQPNHPPIVPPLAVEPTPAKRPVSTPRVAESLVPRQLGRLGNVDFGASPILGTPLNHSRPRPLRRDIRHVPRSGPRHVASPHGCRRRAGCGGGHRVNRARAEIAPAGADAWPGPRSPRGGRVLAVTTAAFVGASDAEAEALAVSLQARRFAAPAPGAVHDGARGRCSLSRRVDLARSRSFPAYWWVV